MSAIWNALLQLSRAGTELISDERDRRRIAVNNAISLVLLGFSSVYAVVLGALGLRLLGLTVFLVAACYLLPVWLNRIGRFEAARLLLITLPNAAIVIFISWMGIRNEVTFFFPAACLPLVVCDLRERLQIALGVTLSVTCALVLSLWADAWMGAHLLSPHAEFQLHECALVGTFVLLLVIVSSFGFSNAIAEKQLRIAQDDVQRLLDSVDQGFVTLDGKGRLRSERSAIFNTWFSTPATGVRFSDCLRAFDTATGSAFAAAWAENTNAKLPLERVMSRLPAQITVNRRYYGLSYRPHLQSNGVQDGVVVVMSDRTAEIARLRAEEKQRAMQLELSQSQKLESVGRLAAGIAHEINTPIQYVGDSVDFVKGGVSQLFELIQEYQVTCRAVVDRTASHADAERITKAEESADLIYLTEHLPKALEQALEGTGRVTAIVRSMKEFAHPDDRDKIAADINRALLSTITVATHAFKSVADVDTQLASIPPVSCYLGSLNQVFLNLIINAADAIEEVVQSTHQKGRIVIKTEQEQEWILISVSDTGAGIPEQVRPKIFDQFFTTKVVGKGTGQGLAIAQRIVASHGGNIWFDTAIGKGTTFFIRLPISGRGSRTTI